MTHGQANIR